LQTLNELAQKTLQTLQAALCIRIRMFLNLLDPDPSIAKQK